MVTSTQIRQTGDGRFEAYDALLKRPMKWTLKPDGTVFASGTGLFAPSFYLEPIELAYPGAFEEELAALDGGRTHRRATSRDHQAWPACGWSARKARPARYRPGHDLFATDRQLAVAWTWRRSQLGKQGAEVIS